MKSYFSVVFYFLVQQKFYSAFWLFCIHYLLLSSSSFCFGRTVEETQLWSDSTSSARSLISSTKENQCDADTKSCKDQTECSRKEILEHIFSNSNYDDKLRPKGPEETNGTTQVKLSIYIRSLENIDDTRMEYTVQMTLRQEWIDPRLKFCESMIRGNYMPFFETGANKIWTPDLFFLNEKKGVLHKLMSPNIFTRIYPNGTVLQSFRVTLLLSCPMDLRHYPLDVQRCPVQMASYGYTEDDMELLWTSNPIQISRRLRMPRFVFANWVYERCPSRGTATGSYSCIILRLWFVREFGYYLIQIYVPCAMLVIVSWVSFWLEPTAVEARVSLGVTTILTIVTQTYGINQTVPPASYVKALDLWMAACMAMVFGALLQFALVNYICCVQEIQRKNFVHPNIERRPKLQRAFSIDRDPVDEGTDMMTSQDTSSSPEVLVKHTKAHYKAKRIDRISRICFPLVFLLFNITYWSVYLLSHYTPLPNKHNKTNS